MKWAVNKVINVFQLESVFWNISQYLNLRTQIFVIVIHDELLLLLYKPAVSTVAPGN